MNDKKDKARHKRHKADKAARQDMNVETKPRLLTTGATRAAALDHALGAGRVYVTVLLNWPKLSFACTEIVSPTARAIGNAIVAGEATSVDGPLPTL